MSVAAASRTHAAATVNSKDSAEIEALDDGIKALDKLVAEATEQRKEENEDYTALMASDAAANLLQRDLPRIAATSSTTQSFTSRQLLLVCKSPCISRMPLLHTQRPLELIRATAV